MVHALVLFAYSGDLVTAIEKLSSVCCRGEVCLSGILQPLGFVRLTVVSQKSCLTTSVAVEAHLLRYLEFVELLDVKGSPERRAANTIVFAMAEARSLAPIREVVQKK